MTSANDLRALFQAERPFIEQAMELAKHFSETRKAVTDKGIDWGAAKALFKAIILDEDDGGDRVAKLLERADFAAAYADFLGCGSAKMNNQNFSSAPRPTQPSPIDAGATGSPRRVAEPAPSRPPSSPGAGSSIPEPDPFLDIRNQPFYRGALS